MYLKVLCNLDGPEIDKKILQEPFEFQFFLELPQSVPFSNEDIRPIYGSPRKVKMKKRAAVSLTSLLQDYGDNDNSTRVPSTAITQGLLGFDYDEDSDTGRGRTDKKLTSTLVIQTF